VGQGDEPGPLRPGLSRIGRKAESVAVEAIPLPHSFFCHPRVLSYRHLKAGQVIVGNVLFASATFRAFPLEIDVFAVPCFFSCGRPRLTRTRDEFRFLPHRRDGFRFLTSIGRAAFPVSRRRLLFLALFFLSEPLTQAGGFRLLVRALAGSFLLHSREFNFPLPLLCVLFSLLFCLSLGRFLTPLLSFHFPRFLFCRCRLGSVCLRLLVCS